MPRRRAVVSAAPETGALDSLSERPPAMLTPIRIATTAAATAIAARYSLLCECGAAGVRGFFRFPAGRVRGACTRCAFDDIGFRIDCRRPFGIGKRRES